MDSGELKCGWRGKEADLTGLTRNLFVAFYLEPLYDWLSKARQTGPMIAYRRHSAQLTWKRRGQIQGLGVMLDDEDIPRLIVADVVVNDEHGHKKGQ